MSAISGEELLRLFPLTANTLLTVVSVWLARRYPGAFVRAWMLAFLGGWVTLATEGLGHHLGRPWPTTVVTLAALTLFIWYMFEAGYRVRGLSGNPRWRLPLLAAALLISAVVAVLGGSYEAIVVPVVLIDFASFIWLGVVFLRLPAFGHRFAARTLGWSLFVNGAWALAYPVLADTPYAWMGYWVNGALLLVIALGLALYLFEGHAHQLALLINESKHHAFILLDPQGRIASWNTGAERLFGFRHEEVFGRDIEVLGAAVPSPGQEANVERIGWSHTKSGARFWSHTTLSPIRDALGELHGFSMLVRDTSETREVEEERLRLAAAVEQSEDAFAITDPHGRVRYLNPAFELRSGQAAAASIGQPIERLLGNFDAAALVPFLEAIEAGGSWSGRILTKGSEPRTEEVHLSPIRRDGVISDFLIRKRDVTNEVALQERLYQAQKNEEIGRLAGGVAHDFGNLLAIIAGHTHLLETGEPAESEGSLPAIRRAVDQAARLIQQLLDFGRRRPSRPQAVDLNQVVSQVAAMLTRLIGKHIKLSTRLGPGLGRIVADPGQLEQVLVNLVINARDAMPEGGTITLETADVDSRGEQAGLPAGRHVCLSVTDTGCGMDAATVARVFEPFFTTKPAGQGSGLGLAMVDRIVRAHGGLVRVQSEEGKGTCFRIYLPSCEAPAADAARAAEPPPSAADRPGTLLIVEGAVELGAAVTLLLEAEGYHLLRARTDEEALQVFERNADSVDLVISDGAMPRTNGGTLATALRRRRPEARLLVIAGGAGSTAASPSGAREGAHVLSKPFMPEDLSRAVREALQRPAGTPATTQG